MAPAHDSNLCTTCGKGAAQNAQNLSRKPEYVIIPLQGHENPSLKPENGRTALQGQKNPSRKLEYRIIALQGHENLSLKPENGRIAFQGHENLSRKSNSTRFAVPGQILPRHAKHHSERMAEFQGFPAPPHTRHRHRPTKPVPETQIRRKRVSGTRESVPEVQKRQNRSSETRKPVPGAMFKAMFTYQDESARQSAEDADDSCNRFTR